MENYTGRRVAIDASMVMYQFLIAVRTSGTGGGPQQAMLTNEAGEVISDVHSYTILMKKIIEYIFHAL